MNTDTRILELLRLIGPKGITGLDLIEITHAWPHRAYPALARFERSGLVVSDWDPGPRPRKRRYWLASQKCTDAGSP